MLDNLRNDVRYAIRQLARAPLFAATACVSIATGVIVAVSAYTLLNALLLKPLPVPDAASLFHVFTSDGDGRSEPYGANSYADYIDFAGTGVFTSLAAERWDAVGVAQDGVVANEFVSFVSPNYFSTLGLVLERGRALGESPNEIVLSRPYRERLYESDASALGKAIRLNGVTLTVVGVAPQSFRGVSLGPPMIGWAPATVMPEVMHEPRMLQNRGSRGFSVFGRLAIPEKAASARLNVLAGALAAQNPRAWTDNNNETRLVTMVDHSKSTAPGNRAELFLAVGLGALLVGFVVLLACTNVAALLLGRAVGRQQEIAVRLSLGASRGRLMRQLLTESALLSLIGGAISLIGLSFAIDIINARVPMAALIGFSVDARAVIVALGTSLACALLFGLAPAHQSLGLDLRASLAGTASSQQRNRFRGILIAAQVAASCLLILVALAAVRGVRSFADADPGIAMDGLVSLEYDGGMFGDDSVARMNYDSRVYQLVHTMPGVRSASRTVLFPLGDSNTESEIAMPDGSKSYVENNTVEPSFFETVGLKAVRGRLFDGGDTRTAPAVAVVNRAFLDEYKLKIGDLIAVGDRRGVQIIGIAPDIAYHDLNGVQKSMMYTLDSQMPWEGSFERYMVRADRGTEAGIADALRAEIHRAFPDQVPPRVETMRARTMRQTMPHRIAGRVALVTGGIELALASIGLYGLLMFALFARRREIGVRLALGASTREASWSVMRDGVRYALYGSAAGVVLAIPAVRVAQQVVPGVRAADPVAFAGAILLVLTVSGIAAFEPARRAARVNPATALRQD
jgi:predicted permease